MKLIFWWVSLTKSERKEVRKHVPDIGRKITHWIHNAEVMNLNDLT